MGVKISKIALALFERTRKYRAPDVVQATATPKPVLKGSESLQRQHLQEHNPTIQYH
jgi:hypothetical protein